MKEIYLVFLLILLIISNSFSQSNENTAPVKWQKYKISGKQFSLILPKLPVAQISTDRCYETENSEYWAYADDVVYSVKISSKTNEKAPNYCNEKRSYDKSSFKLRINEIKNKFPNTETKEKIVNNYKVVELKNNYAIHWLYDDLKNYRWFELVIFHRENAMINSDNFINSFNFGKEVSGIEIGDGANQTLGDELPVREESSEPLSSDSKAEINFPMIVIGKAKPKYTDEARSKNIQGAVKLRVTFLPNGSVGSVTPVTNLGYGLTEQAIKAARKMTFIPANRNGKNLFVTRVVVYTFIIY